MSIIGLTEPVDIGIERLVRERDDARAKLDAMLYQYRACHAEKADARAIAREAIVALHMHHRARGRHVGDFGRCERGLCAKLRALPWAKGDE